MSNERLKSVELKTAVVSQNLLTTTRKPHLLVLVGGGAFLAVDFPIGSDGCFRAKGVFLQKAPKVSDYKSFISFEFKNEEIFEVYFPVVNVKKLINLLYIAK